jgi:hypothetical protein
MAEPEYPQPDPILRYIDSESAPHSFWQMPEQLRSERARAYLIARCGGADEGLAWLWVMDVSEKGNAWARDIVAPGGRQHTDAEIEDAIRRELRGQRP